MFAGGVRRNNPVCLTGILRPEATKVPMHGALKSMFVASSFPAGDPNECVGGVRSSVCRRALLVISAHADLQKEIGGLYACTETMTYGDISSDGVAHRIMYVTV